MTDSINKRTLSNIVANLLEISENSYYRWKKKDHVKLIKLIEQYFADSEIEEFLQTGKIEKFELVKELTLDDLSNLKRLENQIILDNIKRKKLEIKELKLKLNCNKGL
ncbi:hypothetical protein [Aliarcobacter butzleri]|uniref:hypothetical protein n=1 Tax=Aliarcobacter butzleri TaxID=28197 RepID=UPI002B24CF7F|nr:hypothetical protein [Aliarcobacter butzleri]